MPSSSRRIAKNTFILYVRMFIIMIINLFTVRITLHALGDIDYGINTVVAGVVTLFGCVSSVLATATQRYYSFYLGSGDESSLQKIYSVSLNIYILYSLAIIILGESFGLWFLNNRLVIPPERMIAANYLYQFALLSFLFSIVVVPYSAAVIAHEKMGLFAFVSLFECMFRFLGVLALKRLPGDKLVFYGLLLLIIQALVFFIYYSFCKYRFHECTYKRVREKQWYKELISFSGWTLFGSVAGVGMMQVNTILVNLFFGPIVNAARGISLQVNSAVANFSNSFIMAIRPPMIKEYSDGDIEQLNTLFSISNKIIFFLMAVICFPLFFGMPYILKVWLGDISLDTIIFCRLIIVYSFFLSFHNPITIIMQAMGQVKEYFVPVESFTILCVPITYVLFKLHFPASSTYVTMIACIVASHFVRVIQLKKYYREFDLRDYIFRFIVPSLICIIVLALIISVFFLRIQNEIVQLLSVVCFCTFFLGFFGFFVLLSKNERTNLVNILLRKKAS